MKSIANMALAAGLAFLMAGTTATAYAQQPRARTLVIDKVVVDSTPQSGTWLMCITAQSNDIENTFNVPDRVYSGDGIAIGMNLRLGPVAEGDKVDFSMYLDDDQADVCGDQAEDRSADSFVAGTGAKRVNRDHFNYVVHYHMQ